MTLTAKIRAALRAGHYVIWRVDYLGGYGSIGIRVAGAKTVGGKTMIRMYDGFPGSWTVVANKYRERLTVVRFVEGKNGQCTSTREQL